MKKIFILSLFFIASCVSHAQDVFSVSSTDGKDYLIATNEVIFIQKNSSGTPVVYYTERLNKIPVTESMTELISATECKFFFSLTEGDTTLINPEQFYFVEGVGGQTEFYYFKNRRTIKIKSSLSLSYYETIVEDCRTSEGGGGVDTNMAEDNLTLDANRLHDLNGFDWRLKNGELGISVNQFNDQLLLHNYFDYVDFNTDYINLKRRHTVLPELRFYDYSGSNYIGFKSPESLSDTTIYILPESGIDGQVLSVEGDSLYWTNAAILVDSFPQIAGMKAEVGQDIFSIREQAHYVVQADSLDGYATDSVAVHPVSGGYSILKSRNGKIQLSDFGADNTGIKDCSSSLKKAILFSKITKSSISINGGEYLFENSVSSIVDNNITIEGHNNPIFNIKGDNQIIFTGEQILETTISGDLNNSRNLSISVNETTGIEKGDIVTVDGRLCADSDWYYPYKEIHEVESVSSSLININTPLFFSITEKNKWEAIGTGSQTSFYYPAYYVGYDDIEVRINGILQTVGVDYDIRDYQDKEINSQSGDAYGAYIDFTTNPLTTDTLLFNISYSQPVKVYRSGRLIVKGITFNKSESGSGYLINITGCKGLVMENCEFRGYGREQTQGSLINKCVNASITNTTYSKVQYATQTAQSRNITYRDTYGNDVHHLATTSNYSTNVIYNNLGGAGFDNIIDAHPSFYVHIENIEIGKDIGITLRSHGGSIRNINQIGSQATTKANIGARWLSGGGRYGFTIKDNVAGYPFDFIIENINTPVSNTSEIEVFGSSRFLFNNVKLDEISQKKYISSSSTRDEHLELVIENSKINKITVRDIDEMMITDSRIGLFAFGAYYAGQATVKGSIVGMNRNNRRTENVINYDYGTGHVDRWEGAAMRRFYNCTFTNKGSFFEQGSYTANNYVFYNCDFNSSPINFDVNQGSEYRISGLETCKFSNSYASVLRANISSGGADYDPSQTTITISSPIQNTSHTHGLLPSSPDWSNMYRYQRDASNFTYEDGVGGQFLEQAEAIPVIEDGVITDVIITNSGKGYWFTAPTVTVTDASGSGSGAVITISNDFPLQRKIIDKTIKSSNAQNFIEWGVQRIGDNFIWEDESGKLRYSQTMPSDNDDGYGIAFESFSYQSNSTSDQTVINTGQSFNETKSTWKLTINGTEYSHGLTGSEISSFDGSLGTITLAAGLSAGDRIIFRGQKE